MISHQNWKRNWGNNREKKMRFFSQNFDSREENLFAKSHSIEKRKRNFLQNLEFREENENLFFKILTIKNISRKEHSILQLEIEKKWTSGHNCPSWPSGAGLALLAVLAYSSSSSSNFSNSADCNSAHIYKARYNNFMVDYTKYW